LDRSVNSRTTSSHGNDSNESHVSSVSSVAMMGKIVVIPIIVVLAIIVIVLWIKCRSRCQNMAPTKPDDTQPETPEDEANGTEEKKAVTADVTTKAVQETGGGEGDGETSIGLLPKT